MRSEQQKQTHEYFNATATDWRRKAEGVDAKVNIIAQRNNAALRALDDVKPATGGRLLDLGCGTGELVIAAAKRGVDALGVDFAPEMIALCEQKRNAEGAERATFQTASIFDLDPHSGAYDVVAGMGLIEYISRAELERMLQLAAGWVRPGGALVLGSRNRLFNLVSMNDFTTMEQQLGATGALLAESCAIASAPTAEAALAAARANAKEHPEATSHPAAGGIRVETRHQYSPGQLAAILERAGFEARRVFPIHYHAMPPVAARALPQVHVRVATLLNEVAPEDHVLVPWSSSFVLEARRV